MQDVRKFGSGLIYALVSVVLVVGGLSLALAEQGNSLPPTTSSSGASPSPAASGTWTPTGPSPTATPIASSTATPALPTTSEAELVSPEATLIFPTVYVYVPPTEAPPYFACGRFRGWFRSYLVQPGDTLFSIATLYRTSIFAMERANCMASSTIYPGQRLWVPNMPIFPPGLPIVPPGLTVIPTFSTATDVPTESLTPTVQPWIGTAPPLPTTSTASPTDTGAPAPYP